MAVYRRLNIGAVVLLDDAIVPAGISVYIYHVENFLCPGVVRGIFFWISG
jgi:hypothetical protein